MHWAPVHGYRASVVSGHSQTVLLQIRAQRPSISVGRFNRERRRKGDIPPAPYSQEIAPPRQARLPYWALTELAMKAIARKVMVLVNCILKVR